MIQLIEVCKNYGSVAAVKDLNLRIPRGEIFGFIGPNGAGKTTTIKILGGVLQATSGTVAIDGIDMNLEPEKAKRKIGFIPDRPYLYEKLTGREFLQFTADLYGAGDGIKDGIGAMLKKFSLQLRADELIESYSHGMKQRLVIASAVLHEPQVIIVDEPMVGLDPAGIRMIKGLLREMADKGVTVFMSTHILEIAEDLCDRIGIIHHGSLLTTGTHQELIEAARLKQGNLEEIFLILTEENAAI